MRELTSQISFHCLYLCASIPCVTVFPILPQAMQLCLPDLKLWPVFYKPPSAIYSHRYREHYNKIKCCILNTSRCNCSFILWHVAPYLIFFNDCHCKLSCGLLGPFYKVELFSHHWKITSLINKYGGHEPHYSFYCTPPAIIKIHN